MESFSPSHSPPSNPPVGQVNNTTSNAMQPRSLVENHPSSISTLSEVSRSLLSDPETSTLISGSYQYSNSPSTHVMPPSYGSQSALAEATEGIASSSVISNSIETAILYTNQSPASSLVGRGATRSGQTHLPYYQNQHAIYPPPLQTSTIDAVHAQQVQLSQHHQQDTSSSMHSAASLTMNSPSDLFSPSARGAAQSPFSPHSHANRYPGVSYAPAQHDHDSSSATAKSLRSGAVLHPIIVSAQQTNQQQEASPLSAYIQQRGTSLNKGVLTPLSPSGASVFGAPGTPSTIIAPPQFYFDHEPDSEPGSPAPTRSWSTSHNQTIQQHASIIRSSPSSTVPSAVPSRQTTTTTTSTGRSNTASSTASNGTVRPAATTRSIETRSTSLANVKETNAEVGGERRGSNPSSLASSSGINRENLQPSSTGAVASRDSPSGAGNQTTAISLPPSTSAIAANNSNTTGTASGNTTLQHTSNSTYNSNTSSSNIKKVGDIMDFEQMLQSSETKRLTSTPERMRVIEVKKTQFVKLQAKAATVEKSESPLLSRKAKQQPGSNEASKDSIDNDDDDEKDLSVDGKKPLKKQESYWDFLRETGPEDLVAPAQRQDSLQDRNQSKSQAINNDAKRQTTTASNSSSSQSVTVPPPVTRLAGANSFLSGSAPNLSPLSPRQSSQKSASSGKNLKAVRKDGPVVHSSESVTSPTDHDNISSDEEVLGRHESRKQKKKKEDNLSLADFLRNTEPPSASPPAVAQSTSPVPSASGSPNLTKKGPGFKFLGRFGKSTSNLSPEPSRRNTAERSHTQSQQQQDHASHSSPLASNTSLHSPRSQLSTSPTKSASENPQPRFAMLPVAPEALQNDLQPKIAQNALLINIASSSDSPRGISPSTSLQGIRLSPSGNVILSRTESLAGNSHWPSDPDLPTLTTGTPLVPVFGNAGQNNNSRPSSPRSSAPASRRQSILKVITGGNAFSPKRDRSLPSTPLSASSDSMRKLSSHGSKSRQRTDSQGSSSSATKVAAVGTQANPDTIEARIQAVPEVSARAIQVNIPLEVPVKAMADMATSPIQEAQPIPLTRPDISTQTDLAGLDCIEELVKNLVEKRTEVAPDTLQPEPLQESQSHVIGRIDVGTQYESFYNVALLGENPSMILGSSSSLGDQTPESPISSINMLLMSENTRLQQEVTALRLELAQERSKSEQMKILKDSAETRFEQLARVAHRKLSQAIEEKHAVVAAVASAVANTSGIQQSGASIIPSPVPSPATQSFFATGNASPQPRSGPQ